jgi:hypothetical protein
VSFTFYLLLLEKHYTRATNFRKRLATQQPCWLAKFTIAWESMTRRCLSLSELEARSKRKLTTTEQKNMSKPSFVSITGLNSRGWYQSFPAEAKAIDRYIQLRCQESPGQQKVDPRLQAIIEGIFKQCMEDGEYKQVAIFLHGWSCRLMI